MDVLSQILAVFMVLATLGGMLWWLRRKGLAQFSAPAARRKAGRRLELLERLPLTPQHSLHLVRIVDKAVLIALSPSGCTLLDCPSALQSVDLQNNQRPESIR